MINSNGKFSGPINIKMRRLAFAEKTAQSYKFYPINMGAK